MNQLLNVGSALPALPEERLNLLESVIEHANDALFITEGEALDPLGPRIIYTNPACTRMTGYRPEDLFGRTPSLLSGPDTDPATLEVLRDALSNWRSVRVELCHYRKDGTPFWVDLAMAPVVNTRGMFSYWIWVQRDISRRKEAEAAQRTFEERMERAFSEAVLPMSQVSIDGRFLHVNAAMCGMLGYDEQDLVGKSYRDITHPDDVQSSELHLEEVLNGQATSIVLEKRYMRRDGRAIWVRQFSNLARDGQGDPLYFVSQIDDVTERVLAQRRAEHLHALTTALARTLTTESVADVVLAQLCSLLSAHSGTLALLAEEHADLILFTVGEYPVTELRECWQRAREQEIPLKDALRTRQPMLLHARARSVTQFPWLALTAGAVRFQAWAVLPLLVGEQPIGGLILNFTEPRPFEEVDRTFLLTVADVCAQALERARLQMAAQERAGRLAALQAVTADLSAVRTPAEVASVAVVQGAAVLGATACTVRLLSDDGLWLSELDAAGYQPGVSTHFSRVAITEPLPACDAARTGQAVWLHNQEEWLEGYPSTAAPFVQTDLQAAAALPLSVDGRIIGAVGLSFSRPRTFDGAEREFIQTLAQLTAQALERARLYAVEQERAQAAEDLVRLRNDFVAAVSHELRTPLTTIVGYAELLLARWHQLAESQRMRQVTYIVGAANRQKQLVEDLLLLSQVENQALAPHCIPLYLLPLLHQAVEEVRATYAGQIIDLEGESNPRILADPVRVVQVMVNLLDNAAKYSPAGSTVRLTWDMVEEWAEVRVLDHGPGVPEEGLAHLFTRFGRMPGSRVRAGRVGTGLGLFLGRQLAKAMDGDLDLEATGPDGSIFRLRLPVAP